MEILILLLVVSSLNVVLTEDVAIGDTAASKDGYKVRPEQEGKGADDQLAESSQSIGQAYGNAVVGDGLKQIQEGGQIEAHPSGNAGVGHSVVLQDGLRHNALLLNPIQVLQSDSHQGFAQPQQPPHQQYLHQYPLQQIQVFTAEALPLQQTNENLDPQALGYTSYVEHLSDKEQDEIQSALREGSVSDIKRLVPKSGISFKIYHNEKNSDSPTAETNVQITSKPPAAISTLHHRIRNEVPVAPLKVQTGAYQAQALAELQQTPLKSSSGEGYRNSQKLLQPLRQGQQAVRAQTVYYTQPEQHKAFVEVNGKQSYTTPQYKISAAESNYNIQTTGAAVQQNLKFQGKVSKQSLPDVPEAHKQWNFNGKPEGLRGVKPKAPEALHFVGEPLPQSESKVFPYAQSGASGGHSLNKHRAESSFEGAGHGHGHYHPNVHVPKTTQSHFGGQLAHSEPKVVFNRLTGNYVPSEGAKGQVVGAPGTGGYGEQAFKGGRFAAVESQAASQHGFVSHVPKTSFAETKSSQTFDHQKALEGSTSFDIKNAIDSSGSLSHEGNYVSPPTTVTHPVETAQKEQVAYIIPEIPTSTVVIDNSIHSAAVDSHQIKDFGHQLPYPQGGQLHHPPQNFHWALEHYNQGAFPPKDFPQQLVKLHLPKEELYVKNVEFPNSAVSHAAAPQQKQPFVYHYDLPFVKTFPQEVHYQPKTKIRLQANQHLKLTQPVTIDWSLFKSGLPNFISNALGMKQEVVHHVQEPGKKVIPILVRKRKNRSNGKEVGVVYGKVAASRRPVKPSQRQEKTVRVNLLPERTGGNTQQFEATGERKNEFSVSASYKVDRSSRSS